MVTLAAGDWQAVLKPDVGGALAALRRKGVAVLRETPSGAVHPLETACFPLVPYANRIAKGRFAFGTRDIAIAPNFAPQPHPLHGTGWLREWRLVRSDGASALLEDDYKGDGDWPWAYRAHQHVALDETGCTVRLMVENRANQPAPMGLGLHPYFRRREDSTLQFEATAMLGIDDEFLPDDTRHPADLLAPWSKGTKPPEVLVDHCFTGWSGSATITDGLGTISLRGFGAPHCHVFAPPDGEELCVEPVSHTPDALNRDPGAMTMLPPGGVAGIAMRIEASDPT